MGEAVIRSAAPADAARIAEIYAYYVKNTAITYEYSAPDAAEIRRRMAETVRKYPYIVVERDGAVQGYAYASALNERAAYSWSCEVSIYLDRSAHGDGLGRMLYTELEKRLRGMGILNIYACIAYPKQNDKYLTDNSARFHEHLGFVTVGHFHNCACKFGRWYDMVWMEKAADAYPDAPAAVKPYNY